MAVTEAGHRASREIDDLYRAHVGEVYRYAYAVLGNHADAEDVTQTTFLNAYRSLEQGVRPRKPSNWLLTIASNAIKQRFRQDQARPRQVELDDRIASPSVGEDDGPTVGELLTALAKIPPQQRQALVLREFEGRSYAEIAGILGVTTSALETLLFRARRSLVEELQHQLTCTDAQLAVSRSVDGRLGRKERRRLRDHLTDCPDCAGFARLQQRHRSALRGLALVPIPVSLTLFKGLEGTASAAVVPLGVGSAAAGTAVATGAGASAVGSSGGILAGGLGLKAAAVVAAAGVAGGVGVAGSSELEQRPGGTPKPAAQQTGKRLGQVAPRGVSVPGNGIAVGKATAPGQSKATRTGKPGTTSAKSRAAFAKAKARGQLLSREKRAAAAKRRADAKSTGKARASAATAKPRPTRKPKPTAKPVRAANAPTAPTAAATTPTTDGSGTAEESGSIAPTASEPAASQPPAGKGNGKAGGPKG